jgi:dTDP-glucose pyrophosphorylase/ADP-ribose pyrophosphatase YjhB (NUDIX family)
MSEPRPGLPASALTAVILAGGAGSRLRAAVADRPKPLAWVAGRPFVCHLLEILEKMGVRRTILATGHLAEQFPTRLGDTFGAMRLDYVVEVTPLGTGGALRQACDSVTTPYVLALNGDSYCEFDPAALLAAQPAGAEVFTMVVQRLPGSTRFGAVLYNDGGRITGFVEKAEGPEPRAGINAGVYLAPTKFFQSVEPGKKISLEQEYFPHWARAGKMQAFPVAGRFIDIGLPASFAEAQEFFRGDVTPEFATLADLQQSSAKAAALLTPRSKEEINGWKLAVGVIVRDSRGRILLERREDCGLWGLLGGRMDYGEAVEQTAVREVKEETGLDIIVERLVGVYSDPRRVVSYPNGDVVQPVVVVVEAAATPGEITPSQESLEVIYFEPNSLPRLVMPHAQSALRDCLQGRTTSFRPA